MALRRQPSASGVATDWWRQTDVPEDFFGNMDPGGSPSGVFFSGAAT